MIRKASLREWFLIYQLNWIEKSHAHLPFILKINTKKLNAHFGDNIPLTTLLVKACGLWSEKCPIVRKQVFKTFYGLRIYENKSGSVNVPFLLKYNSGPYLSVMTVEDAGNKSLNSIQGEFQEYAKKDPKTLLIGKRILDKNNNFYNRARLKIIHFLVNNFPRIHNKLNVGTVSVSSLLKFENPKVQLTTTAKGPGAFSLCVSSFDRKNNCLEIGISWDHQTGDGYQGVEACATLGAILQGEDEELFKKLIN